MITSEEFDRLIRDALTNLYDHVALEVHPINTVIVKPPEMRGTRAEYLQRIFFDAIESLQPRNKDFSDLSPEVRPYRILHDRYISGISLAELQTRLALSERQLRREHARSLRALASLLWDQIYPGIAYRRPPESEEPELPLSQEDSQEFQIQTDRLALGEIVQSVISMLDAQLKARNASISIDFPFGMPLVQTDAVVLRLVLLSLFNLCLHLQREHGLQVQGRSDADGEKAILEIHFEKEDLTPQTKQEVQDVLATARYWLAKLNCKLLDAGLSATGAGLVTILIDLPVASQPVILVIDDQEPAIRLYQSYLWQSGLRVVGLRDATQVSSEAIRLKPLVVLLDVMMPGVDGWRVLQSLKADPATHSIPVLVCSVWNEPDLASSLGAAGFLKKPIKQKDLLAALNQLGVRGISGESFPVSS